MPKELLQIPLTINASMVRREMVDGADCIIINSATLPDNIVMNGGLYPAEEIANSFASLERVLAPVGHPEKDGKYISANDPYAIHNFDVGAYVANVERKNGKVYHDTVINIDVANQTERGRELLEAIANMEKNGTPIHTSTGVLLEREPLDEPQTNAAGLEYSWIARNMTFDHNAILPNQIGAATPEQGVGMMVNSADVDLASFEGNEEFEDESIDDMFNDLRDMLKDKIAQTEIGAKYIYIAEVFDRAVVYEVTREDNTDDYYRVEYAILDGEVQLGTEKVKVKRRFSWATNKLKSFIKNMGFAKPIQETYNETVTNSISDEGLEMTQEEMQALLDAQSEKLEANFDKKLAPLSKKVASLEANAQSAEKAERAPLEAKAEAKGLSADEIKAMSTNALKVAFGDAIEGDATYAAGGEPVANAEQSEFSRELP
ncbi:MAG: hypothetical protein KTR16_11675 [Acidiferrobacterales bacterium]|nr:hypothetical protein [Acidiferrobacterales bacterium]